MGIDFALQDLLVRGHTSNSAVGAFAGRLTLSGVLHNEVYLPLSPHGKQDFASLGESIESGPIRSMHCTAQMDGRFV